MNFTDTPTVFIVDDDASVREGMAWLLRTRRLLSESFESAESFLSMLQSNFQDTGNGPSSGQHWPRQAACVLLDVRMPKMTGLELQAWMVQTGDRIPVIFMSGESLPHETLAAQESNAVTFLWKPFRTEALLNAVSLGLTLHDQQSG